MKIKNTLGDLNNILFEQIERLNDTELSGEELDVELKRGDQIQKIAAQIIQNGHLAFKVMCHMDEYGLSPDAKALPSMLEVRK